MDVIWRLFSIRPAAWVLQTVSGGTGAHDRSIAAEKAV
jgi:hypothetical protein